MRSSSQTAVRRVHWLLALGPAPGSSSRGRPPKLNYRQKRHSAGLYWTGRSTVREIGELITVSRSTIYRALPRADRTGDSDAAHSTGESAPGMQSTWNTVAQNAGLLSLDH